MGALLRALELHKRPVVTMTGEAVGLIKDMIYGTGGGDIAALAIGKRGLLSGAAKSALPWPAVIGLGPDAVIIPTEGSLVPLESFLGTVGVGSSLGAGDVVGAEVLTSDGGALGTVADIIIEFPARSGEQVDVVGYEIAPHESLGRGTTKFFIPLPDALSVSRDNLVVPASVRDYLTDDLGSLDEAVTRFRAAQAGGR